MEKQLVKEVVDGYIDIHFAAEEAKICNPGYYKNQYLVYAFEHHMSPQCILRTYAEMLKTGCAYTTNHNDQKHANRLIKYINTYSGKRQLEFVNTCMSELEKETQSSFPYLIASAYGRFKSFRSFEAKVRLKIALDDVYCYLLENLRALPDLSEAERTVELESGEKKILPKLSDFSEADFSYATMYLKGLKLTNAQKNPIKDLVGYRVIADAINRSSKEDDLISFIYEYVTFLTDFFNKKGYDIIDIKNYIEHPKANNYQSYHCRVDMLELLLEIQLRTGEMHKNAETGSASHNKYKDTTIQKFLNQFLREISGEKESMNERLGLLKELWLPSTSWCFTPNEEIPTTPAELKEFAEPEIIQAIFASAV